MMNEKQLRRVVRRTLLEMRGRRPAGGIGFHTPASGYVPPIEGIPMVRLSDEMRELSDGLFNLERQVVEMEMEGGNERQVMMLRKTIERNERRIAEIDEELKGMKPK